MSIQEPLGVANGTRKVESPARRKLRKCPKTSSEEEENPLEAWKAISKSSKTGHGIHWQQGPTYLEGLGNRTGGLGKMEQLGLEA